MAGLAHGGVIHRRRDLKALAMPIGIGTSAISVISFAKAQRHGGDIGC